jgi:hypothetical protein
VSGNQYSGGGAASSAGVLLYGGCGDPLVKNVSVTGNTLTNNDVGAEPRLQGLAQVVEQVVAVFDAHRQPDQVSGDLQL